VLSKVVEDQLLELRGYKTEQIEAAISSIKQIFESNIKITSETLD